MADPHPRRRTFGPVVVLGLAAGALTAVSGSQRTVGGTGRSANADSSLSLTFDGHMPLVTGLALVVLACWGVVLVTRGRVRRAVAALATLAAAGAVAAAVAGYWQVGDQLRDQLTGVGITDPSVGHTGWYWAALVGAVVSLAAAVLAVAWAPAWPEMGARYDAPAARPSATPTGEPEEQSSLDLWKAMDEGRDPTATDPE
jgi:uncharacterized membrane protein (TIGR02234 family)